MIGCKVSHGLQQDHEVVLVDVFDTVAVESRPMRTSLRLVLLDVGITACLGEKDRQNFKAVFKAVVRGQVGAEWCIGRWVLSGA